MSDCNVQGVMRLKMRYLPRAGEHSFQSPTLPAQATRLTEALLVNPCAICYYLFTYTQFRIGI